MKLPDRWLNYTPVGSVIPGTRFIACKVPLRATGLQNTPKEEWFTPQDLMSACPDVGMVIDLTNTTKYYSPMEFTSDGIQYEKVATQGHMVPNNLVFIKFCKAVDKFLSDSNNEGSIIAVHCTHGVNRTGYLICRYMIDKLQISPEESMKLFHTARGHEIERPNYINNLRKRLTKATGPLQHPITPKVPLHQPTSLNVPLHHPTYQNVPLHQTTTCSKKRRKRNNKIDYIPLQYNMGENSKLNDTNQPVHRNTEESVANRNSVQMGIGTQYVQNTSNNSFQYSRPSNGWYQPNYGAREVGAASGGLGRYQLNHSERQIGKSRDNDVRDNTGYYFFDNSNSHYSSRDVNQTNCSESRDRPPHEVVTDHQHFSSNNIQRVKPGLQLNHNNRGRQNSAASNWRKSKNNAFSGTQNCSVNQPGSAGYYNWRRTDQVGYSNSRDNSSAGQASNNVKESSSPSHSTWVNRSGRFDGDFSKSNQPNYSNRDNSIAGQASNNVEESSNSSHNTWISGNNRLEDAFTKSNQPNYSNRDKYIAGKASKKRKANVVNYSSLSGNSYL